MGTLVRSTSVLGEYHAGWYCAGVAGPNQVAVVRAARAPRAVALELLPGAEPSTCQGAYFLRLVEGGIGCARPPAGGARTRTPSRLAALATPVDEAADCDVGAAPDLVPLRVVHTSSGLRSASVQLTALREVALLKRRCARRGGRPRGRHRRGRQRGQGRGRGRPGVHGRSLVLVARASVAGACAMLSHVI